MKKIHYITYNDLYNGVYQGQVIDVVNHLNNNTQAEVKLIAFVSPKLWLSQRKKIKTHLPKAIVFPILGRLTDWNRSKFLLNFIKNKKNAICRGPLGFNVAEGKYKTLVYDGRAAVKAEIEEYNVVTEPMIKHKLIEAEKNAVEKSNFRIAVSKALIAYWKNELKLNFDISKSFVIPCTITSEQQTHEIKLSTTEIKLVYAGGTGPWQAFEETVALIKTAMSQQAQLTVTFLTKPNEFIDELAKTYPERVQRLWVAHAEVNAILQSCDYGLLIRNNNNTNKVASPVKFAEYLGAGLDVIISENLGDFSNFVIENNCGLIVKNELPIFEKVSKSKKLHNTRLCENNFFKTAEKIDVQYQKLINTLTT